MTTAVSLSSASSHSISSNLNHSNYLLHTTSSTSSTASDRSRATTSTKENTSLESDSTNHSIKSISIPGKPPTITQPPYHNPRYLGSIPFYYPKAPSTSPAIQNPYHKSINSTTSDIDKASSSPSDSSSSRRFHQSSLDTCWDSFQTSCDELKTNEAWGDDFQTKTSNSFRIYFQNVNSCSLSTSSSKMSIIAKSLSQAECDFINLAQTSINWKFLSLRERLKQTIQKHIPINRIIVGSNKYESEQPTLPGGVSQIVSGDWTGRIVQYVHDFRKMGRWCGTKIRLRHDRYLYIICAYRVCDQSLNQVGVETAYGQQHYMMTLDGIHNSNPRKLFIDDLIQAVKQWQSDSVEIIIVLDANEQIGRSTHGLSNLMRECKLVDLFHQHHGIQPDFATYERGSTRLDYAIGSATLLPFLTRCGYLPFFQGIQSDHRGLFLDISHELIDGLTRIERTPSRYLHSAYQRDVYKYKQHVLKAFHSHNIFQKASDLCTMADPIKREDPSYILALNNLDSLIVSIQLKAEQKCCKRRTKYDWSDDIYHTKRILTYWSLKRKSIKFKRDVSKITKAIYISIPESFRQYIDVAGPNPVSNYNKMQKQLVILLVQHRTMLASIHKESVDNEAAFTGTSNDQIIRKREQKKQDKRLYSTLRQHFHPTTRAGIAHLLLPENDADGNPTDNVDLAETWRTETDPTEVLQHLFDRNIRHFGQADGEQLIKGGIIPIPKDAISSPTYDVLDRLADTTKRHPIYHDLISFDSFRKAIQKWRESTSTSPSGRHLGHYKSLLSIDSFASKYTESIPDPGPDILQVIFQISSSAFNSGLTLDRWKQVTTCMIEKIPGVPRINKLRVIHLYEAGYNGFLKLAWQRGVVWRAHQNGTLNAAQAGSRPHHTCMEVVMSKEMKYLNSRLTRQPMATMDNDAKSCYDRVVASLALLISHHFGVPEEICNTVGETLRTMQFKLRTALGDSEQFYSHSDSQPIHGVGQGGTASPALWLLVSSVLFDCYQSKASGMKMADPTHQFKLHQWIEAIVDDTSIFTNVDRTATIDTLVRTLEQDAQYWENLLSVSGGCLELSKCFYYVLAWTFTDKGALVPLTPAEIEHVSTRVHLQEFGKQAYTAIESKPPHEAHKTLGIWKTMIGDDSNHITSLFKRSSNIAAIVGTSGMHPYQAEVAVRMIYTPAMGYSLPALNIPESVITNIQNKAMQSFVPAMGFNRRTPHAILYGPTEFGGVGIPHLYTECRIQQIISVMMHLRAQTNLGTLFMINLNWTQLHIGLGSSCFEMTRPIPWVDNWFFGIREFLQRINGKLSIRDLYIPQLERQHDQFIMAAAWSLSPALSLNQLCYVNYWRFYYQVQTLSDITDARGACILDVYLKHPVASDINSLRLDRKSKYDWPYQPPPTSVFTFKLWVRTLRRCFLQAQGTSLRQPLGPWTLPASLRQSNWQSYITTGNEALFLRQDNGFHLYSTILKRTSTTVSYDPAHYTIVDSIPEACIPIQVMINDRHILVQHFKQTSVAPISKPTVPPVDIQQAIQQAPVWQKQLLQHFHIPDPTYLQQCLENDTNVLIASDGGMKDGKGSFGISAGTNTQTLYSLEGPAIGNSDLMNSYRSEGYGMLASFCFLLLFVATHKVKVPLPKVVKVYCDNSSLVDIINDIAINGIYPRMHINPDFDVIMQIIQDVSDLRQHNILVSVTHVKGHQDKTVDYIDLSRPSQLNVDADHQATNYLRYGANYSYSEFPTNPISLYINDNIIPRSHKSRMRSASTSPNLRSYMICRFNWKSGIPDLIWCEVHGSTIASFNKNDRRRIRKFIYKWLPTNERLFSYKQTPDPNCVSCKVVCETHAHLLKCCHGQRQILKDKWYTGFNDFLDNERYTPPLVGKLLKDHILSESSLNAPPTVPLLPADIQYAYNDQARIGWDHLPRGRLALRWGNVIATHLSTNHIPEKEMSALIWGRRVTKELYKLILLLWNHRNEDAHGIKNHLESPLARIRILNQIDVFQQSNPAVNYTERDFIFRPRSVLEQYSVCNLKAWYKQATTIAKTSSMRSQMIQIQQPHRTLDSYFAPIGIHDPDNPRNSTDLPNNNEMVVAIDPLQ